MKYFLKIFRTRCVVLSISALAPVLTGCVKEPVAPGSDGQTGGEAIFRVIVPGMATPSSTRALNESQEKQIDALDVLVFRNVDNKLIQWKSVAVADISVSGDGWAFTIKDFAETDDITLAVVANASAEVGAMLTAVGGVAANPLKTAVLEKLTYTLAASKWVTAGAGTMYLPMYGEVSVAGSIYGAVSHSVNLTRMLAKVDVVNGVAPTGTPTDGKFELTSVHVVNRNTSGLIAPKWNATTGAPETPPATTPNLPAGFSPGTIAWSSGNELTYMLSAGQTSLESEIYLFESSALSGNPATPDGLRLVFEGNYTSGGGVTKKYYYPVDFTTPAGAYMPLLRNHRYLFTITEAAGRGYDGLGEAVAAFGVMSNLRTSLVVVDESGINHIIWNGEHFLGVSEKAFTVAAAGQQNVALQISTNYPGGWKAAVENAATNSWLTLGASSGQLTDKTLTFSAATLTGEWAARSASIVLTAGRLETRLTVSQGDYKIVAEPASSYLLDGTTQHSFKVKSNTQWAVRSVNDPNEILLNSTTQIVGMLTRTGGNNTTTGDDFTFTLVNDTDGSLSGKTFTVTFRDPAGKANDITVTVTAVACGCNGTAIALKIGTNGYTNNPGVIGTPTYLTHMYGDKCWMVQNTRELIAYTGSYVFSTQFGSISYSQNSNSTGYFYFPSITYTANVCPSGWRLPTAQETATLITQLNANNYRNFWSSDQTGWYSTKGTPSGWVVGNQYKRWLTGWGSIITNDYGVSYGSTNHGDEAVLYAPARCVRD